MWEGVRQYSVEGLFIFQATGILKSEQVMGAFSKEMTKLMKLVSHNPNIDTGTLVSNIEPPFTNTVIREKQRRRHF